MEQTASFRNAAFGGFQRQDVLDYIKKTAQDHKAQLDELKQALEESRNTLAERDTRIAELEGQLKAMEQDAASARDAQQAAQEEIESLRKEVDEYNLLKSSVAEIEMDARRRATQILSDAQAHADDLVRTAASEKQQLLEDAQRQAQEMRSSAMREVSLIDNLRKKIMTRTREDIVRCSTELHDGVSEALRSTEMVRQLLVELSDSFDKRAAAFDSFTEEE